MGTWRFAGTHDLDAALARRRANAPSVVGGGDGWHVGVHDRLLQLQRLAGNAAVTHALRDAQRRRNFGIGEPSVQRLPEDAVSLASELRRYRYHSFDEVLSDKHRFQPDDWRSIVSAYNRGQTSGVRLRFVHPSAPPEEQSTTGDMSRTEVDALRRAQEALSGTPHGNFMVFLHGRLQAGGVSLSEFYRGGHIVLNDQGTVYSSLVDQYGALMKPRLTSKRETSHYTAGAGYDTTLEAKTPQMGVDLPLPLTGHILFGIVPPRTNRKDSPDEGNTFIQTEGYGFQTAYTTYVGHAFGFLANIIGGVQTGMLGSSKASEKTGKQVVEQ